MIADLDPFDDDGHVVVRIGETEIARLKAVTTSRAGHGDDSTFFASEERRVVEETVAAWVTSLINR